MSILEAYKTWDSLHFSLSFFFFPRVVSPICLSPSFRLLRLYTGEQNNGSLEEIDALLGMESKSYRPLWLTCSCPRSAKPSCSCGKSCVVYDGGRDALLATSGREAGEAITFSGK